MLFDSHIQYLQAGSDIISTATYVHHFARQILLISCRYIRPSSYQCSFITFERAGFSHEEAVIQMREAVQIAQRAKDAYMRKNPGRSIKIALSLGPLGAMLQPPQEYSGNYPPPYGPALPTAGGEIQDEMMNNAEEALIQFHFERLDVFASDPATWAAIDIIAFETVPLAREALAIRKAMHQFYQRPIPAKPWWISFVIAEGSSFIDAAAQKAGAALCSSPRNAMPPNAIGINCTDIPRLEPVLDRICLDHPDIIRDYWLVVYPNGGWHYDPVTKQWHSASELVAKAGRSLEETWANQLYAAIESHRSRWRGVVIGGCCKCGVSHIEMLRRRVDQAE